MFKKINTPNTNAIKLTFSELGVTGEPEGGLLPWVSVPESRLSGGFKPVLGLPAGGQPVSLAKAQREHSKFATIEKRIEWLEMVEEIFHLNVVTT